MLLLSHLLLPHHTDMRPQVAHEGTLILHIKHGMVDDLSVQCTAELKIRFKTPCKAHLIFGQTKSLGAGAADTFQ